MCAGVSSRRGLGFFRSFHPCSLELADEEVVCRAHTTRVRLEPRSTACDLLCNDRQLGQAVPVLGTVLGAGMNARLLSSVTDDANHIYRERFLRER